MVESYDVAIKVISQKGTCHAGHKVGDEWVISGTEYQTPAGICPAAFSGIFPFITALMFGGEFPWESEPDATCLCCIDPQNPVVFELRRLRK